LLINFFGVINIAHDYVLIVASIFWGFGAFLFILWKEKFLLKVPLIIMLIIGIMVFLAAWNSLIFSRQVGVNYFLSVLMLVWISDIAAYFGGKAIGRTKLAPTISPGKTWEGVFFGILGVIALAFIWILCDQYFENKNRSFFSQIFQLDFISFFMTLIFLTSIGVIGDLFESLLKRSVGLKDSSRLLPGHGGVLDRIDALLPVLTMTTFISIFIVK
jgi:phosphatidate cytidylyltransferase